LYNSDFEVLNEVNHILCNVNLKDIAIETINDLRLSQKISFTGVLTGYKNSNLIGLELKEISVIDRLKSDDEGIDAVKRISDKAIAKKKRENRIGILDIITAIVFLVVLVFSIGIALSHIMWALVFL